MKFIIFSILLHFITACKYWQSAPLSVLVVGDMSMLTFFNCIFYFCFVFVHCMCSRMRALIICTWCVIMLSIKYRFSPREKLSLLLFIFLESRSKNFFLLFFSFYIMGIYMIIYERKNISFYFSLMIILKFTRDF